MTLKLISGNSETGKIYFVLGMFPDVCADKQDLSSVKKEDILIDSSGTKLVVDRCVDCDAPLLHTLGGDKKTYCSIHGGSNEIEKGKLSNSNDTDVSAADHSQHRIYPGVLPRRPN